MAQFRGKKKKSPRFCMVHASDKRVGDQLTAEADCEMLEGGKGRGKYFLNLLKMFLTSNWGKEPMRCTDERAISFVWVCA